LTRTEMNLHEVDTIIFDFDGVFTDNSVYMTSDGTELLKFSKYDSLGLDIFRDYLALQKIQIKLVVLSKEKSQIVSLRSQKIGLDCKQGIEDKWSYISRTLFLKPGRYIYFGNDLNDLESMENAYLSFAPIDAHPRIKAVANFVSSRRGGDGFVREGLEFLMNQKEVKHK
jgi:YrbI family 3-deoxy-D-manno-octulosonate 8-phosphate phosphatase